MKKPLAIIVYILFGVYVIAALAVNFLAYFVTSESAGIMYDGLGRPLVLAPALLRLVFGTERLYPGFYWFLFDTTLFFGVFILGALVGKVSEWATSPSQSS